MIETIIGEPITEELVQNYLDSLVGCFFKILPMKESEEPSLLVYMESLRVEIAGCKRLISVLDNDEGIIELLSILQYLIDNPDYPTRGVKREVFKAIGICNKLKSKFVLAV